MPTLPMKYQRNQSNTNKTNLNLKPKTPNNNVILIAVYFPRVICPNINAIARLE